MYTTQQYLTNKLQEIEKAGLYKRERLIDGPQQAEIRVKHGNSVLNLCANNYLGLANHPAIIAAAHRALDEWGYGLASVRFICGTQSIHKQLEQKISEFLGTDDSILYSSCFDANGGLFETLLDEQDAVISDELNHASIIDGIRLSKAARFRYRNGDMADLESKLKEASSARNRPWARFTSCARSMSWSSTSGNSIFGGRLRKLSGKPRAMSRTSLRRTSWPSTLATTGSGRAGPCAAVAGLPADVAGGAASAGRAISEPSTAAKKGESRMAVLG